MTENLLLLISYIVLWVFVIILGILMVATLRHLGVMFEALDPVLQFSRSGFRLRPDDPLPQAELTDSSGSVVEIDQPGDSSLMLLLVDRGCTACTDALAALSNGDAAHWHKKWTSVVVVRSRPQDVSETIGSYNLHEDITIAFDASGKASKAWGVTTTPFAIVIDGARRVRRTYPVVSGTQIREILQTNPKELLRPMTWHSGAAGPSETLERSS